MDRRTTEVKLNCAAISFRFWAIVTFVYAYIENSHIHRGRTLGVATFMQERLSLEEQS